MKILRLNLLAFGPFTGVHLNLERGNHGLHLVYGPNEAGKSSALRALRQMFFGIDERTTDHFLHPHGKLRIGACLRHQDGSLLEFIRRKGRQKTLRGADDDTVLDGQELSRFLGGASQDLFASMFGIDHQTLVEGGQQIVQGGGQLGQVLFSAGSGIADLRAVQENLQAEMEALFKPAGKNQKITQTIQKLRDAQEAARRQYLASDEWVRHDKALTEAQENRVCRERERQEKTRELNRLMRIRNALKPIAGRRRLLEEWQGYRDAVLLPDDFRDRRSQALNDLLVAQSQAEETQQAIDQLDRQLGQVEVPEALLEQTEKIEDLYRRLGEYRKGVEDRPQRLLQMKQLEHEAKEILRSLGKPADLAQADPLRLRADEQIAIQTLGNQHQGLVVNLENARQAILGLRGRIDRAREKLEALASLPEPAELRRAIRRTQQQGDLESQLADALAGLRQAEAKAHADLARLPHWSGTLDDLEQLPLPAPETVDRFEKTFEELRLRRDSASERVGEEKAALRELEGQLRQLELLQEVPTEEDLHQVRKQRDTGWQLVRRAWQEGEEDHAEVRAYLSASGSARDLAEAYERSVAGADQVADRLRREADRVARKVELITHRDKRLDQRDRQTRQLADTEGEFETVQKEWAALWQPLGVAPLPPREMRTWLRKQTELARQAGELRDRRRQADALQEVIQSQSTQLGTCLEKHGQGPAGTRETLAALLERSQEVVDCFDTVQKQRGQLEKEIAERTQELHEAETLARQADGKLAGWQDQWARAMTRLGLESDASPSSANVFLASITRLFQMLHEADGFRRRIEGLDRDSAQFGKDVQLMVESVAPDLAPLEPGHSVEELNRRLTQRRAAQERREVLGKQRSREADRLGQAEKLLASSKLRLEAMCREANCRTPEELVQAEEHSDRRRQLEKDIHEIEEQLLAPSAGASLEDFIADAAKVDPDGLEMEIEQLGEDITILEREISQFDQTIGSERTELQRMDGSAAAAEGAEQAQYLLAQLQADVQQYVALRLAGAVLREGIERYRDKNQRRVLERASRLFAGLTGGSFEGLRIEDNEQGQAVLFGIRPGGRDTVSVEGMSDGCSDQLYLAVRLASLEAWLAAHEPLPFIVDDILLNFDNERAVAALEALADLSRHTQVIFFTHHEHLVELAEQHLDAGVLFVHRIAHQV